MEELELLNKIKEQLLDKGEISVVSWSPQRYILNISSDDWHKIFKTDEYNNAKNK